MTRRLLTRWGFIGLALVSLSTDRAWCQTVAPGPYYATPSWDQTLPCTSPSSCPRFIVLSNFNSEAVLDRDTGLVWERTPMGPDPRFFPPITGRVGWIVAKNHCNFRNVAGRVGWRLPSLQELATLVDFTNGDALSRALAPGHPFIGIERDYYWSATTDPSDSRRAFVVSFEFPTSAFQLNTRDTTTLDFHFVWCVRGGN